MEVRDHASLRSGRVAPTSIPSVASPMPPTVVANFIGRFPGIEVQVMELGADAVHQRVANSNADLGIAAESGRNSELSFDFVCATSLWFSWLSTAGWPSTRFGCGAQLF